MNIKTTSVLSWVALVLPLAACSPDVIGIPVEPQCLDASDGVYVDRVIVSWCIGDALPVANVTLWRYLVFDEPYANLEERQVEIAYWTRADIQPLIPPVVSSTGRRTADIVMSAVDTTATPGVRYRYYVDAQGGDGNLSTSRWEYGHAGTLPAAAPRSLSPSALSTSTPILALSGALTPEGAMVWMNGALHAGTAAAPALEAIRAANPALDDAQIRTILARSTTPLDPATCPGAPAPGYGWLDPAQAIALAAGWGATSP